MFRIPDASQAAARFPGNGDSIGNDHGDAGDSATQAAKAGKHNKGRVRIWHPELVDFNKVGRHERTRDD
ncbi:hypothetical protein [Thiolapillus sp.]